jgi:hypothetical protein
VAAGTIWVTKEGRKTNLANVLTKLLPQATKEFLCDQFMYWMAKGIGIACHGIGYLLGMYYMWPNFFQV